MYKTIETNEDVFAWEAAEKEALDKVRLAFHLDTQEVNSLNNCMLVDEDFMRRCAKFYEGVSNEDSRDFQAYLRRCTDAQVMSVLEKETGAGRAAFQSLAKLEATRRHLVGPPAIRRRSIPEMVQRPSHWVQRPSH